MKTKEKISKIIEKMNIDEKNENKKDFLKSVRLDINTKKIWKIKVCKIIINFKKIVPCKK